MPCPNSGNQSPTSHKTLQMVQKYRAQARQRMLTKAAQSKWDKPNTNGESVKLPVKQFPEKR